MALIQTSLLVLMALSSFSIQAEGLECHRCLFIDPYPEAVQEIVQLIIDQIAAEIGRTYVYDVNCEKAPKNDLVTAEPLPINLLSKTLSNVILKLEGNGSVAGHTSKLTEANMLNLGSKSLIKDDHVDAETAFCVAAKMKISVATYSLTVIIRDGVVVDDQTTPKQSTCIELDAILELLIPVIGDDVIDQIKDIVKTMSACACTGEACNSDVFEDPIVTTTESGATLLTATFIPLISSLILMNI